MNFEQTIEQLKSGKKVSRHSWGNGEVYLEMRPQDESAKNRRIFMFYPTDDTSIGIRCLVWIGCPADIIADDWFVK